MIYDRTCLEKGWGNLQEFGEFYFFIFSLALLFMKMDDALNLQRATIFFLSAEGIQNPWKYLMNKKI